MAFVMTLGFATEHDRDAFAERTLPRVRGQQADPQQPAGEGDALHRLGVAVTSASAARELCHHIVAFLAHSKSMRVDVEWAGPGGELQRGAVNSDASRDAETLAVRVGAAAKAHLDAEKQ